MAEEIVEAERMGAMGRVSAMVGHDLRGPLQNINNALYLMEKAPERSAELMETIKNSVTYASDMLEEFRHRTSDIHPSFAMVSLETLLQEIVNDSLLLDTMDFKLLLGKDLGTVHVDRMMIHRVIDNLIRNAVEAMPEGGKLTLKCERTDDNVIIKVSDTGGGIPDEFKENMFKPFYSTKPGGMGLGLAYCKRAVEAHGGTIEVESEVDRGTTFTVRIPDEHE